MPKPTQDYEIVEPEAGPSKPKTATSTNRSTRSSRNFTKTVEEIGAFSDIFNNPNPPMPADIMEGPPEIPVPPKKKRTSSPSNKAPPGQWIDAIVSTLPNEKYIKGSFSSSQVIAVKSAPPPVPEAEIEVEIPLPKKPKMPTEPLVHDELTQEDVPYFPPTFQRTTRILYEEGRRSVELSEAAKAPFITSGCESLVYDKASSAQQFQPEPDVIQSKDITSSNNSNEKQPNAAVASTSKSFVDQNASPQTKSNPDQTKVVEPSTSKQSQLNVPKRTHQQRQPPQRFTKDIMIIPGPKATAVSASAPDPPNNSEEQQVETGRSFQQTAEIAGGGPEAPKPYLPKKKKSVHILPSPDSLIEAVLRPDKVGQPIPQRIEFALPEKFKLGYVPPKPDSQNQNEMAQPDPAPDSFISVDLSQQEETGESSSQETGISSPGTIRRSSKPQETFSRSKNKVFYPVLKLNRLVDAEYPQATGNVLPATFGRGVESLKTYSPPENKVGHSVPTPDPVSHTDVRHDETGESSPQNAFVQTETITRKAPKSLKTHSSKIPKIVRPVPPPVPPVIDLENKTGKSSSSPQAAGITLPETIRTGTMPQKTYTPNKNNFVHSAPTPSPVADSIVHQDEMGESFPQNEFVQTGTTVIKGPIPLKTNSPQSTEIFHPDPTPDPAIDPENTTGTSLSSPQTAGITLPVPILKGANVQKTYEPRKNKKVLFADLVTIRYFESEESSPLNQFSRTEASTGNVPKSQETYLPRKNTIIHSVTTPYPVIGPVVRQDQAGGSFQQTTEIIHDERKGGPKSLKTYPTQKNKTVCPVPPPAPEIDPEYHTGESSSQRQAKKIILPEIIRKGLEASKKDSRNKNEIIHPVITPRPLIETVVRPDKSSQQQTALATPGTSKSSGPKTSKIYSPKNKIVHPDAILDPLDARFSQTTGITLPITFGRGAKVQKKFSRNKNEIIEAVVVQHQNKSRDSSQKTTEMAMTLEEIEGGCNPPEIYSPRFHPTPIDNPAIDPENKTAESSSAPQAAGIAPPEAIRGTKSLKTYSPKNKIILSVPTSYPVSQGFKVPKPYSRKQSIVPVNEAVVVVHQDNTGESPPKSTEMAMTLDEEIDEGFNYPQIYSSHENQVYYLVPTDNLVIDPEIKTGDSCMQEAETTFPTIIIENSNLAESSLAMKMEILPPIPTPDLVIDTTVHQDNPGESSTQTMEITSDEEFEGGIKLPETYSPNQNEIGQSASVPQPAPTDSGNEMEESLPKTAETTLPTNITENENSKFVESSLASDKEILPPAPTADPANECQENKDGQSSPEMTETAPSESESRLFCTTKSLGVETEIVPPASTPDPAIENGDGDGEQIIEEKLPQTAETVEVTPPEPNTNNPIPMDEPQPSTSRCMYSNGQNTSGGTANTTTGSGNSWTQLNGKIPGSAPLPFTNGFANGISDDDDDASDGDYIDITNSRADENDSEVDYTITDDDGDNDTTDDDSITVDRIENDTIDDNGSETSDDEYIDITNGCDDDNDSSDNSTITDTSEDEYSITGDGSDDDTSDDDNYSITSHGGDTEDDDHSVSGDGGDKDTNDNNDNEDINEEVRSLKSPSPSPPPAKEPENIRDESWYAKHAAVNSPLESIRKDVLDTVLGMVVTHKKADPFFYHPDSPESNARKPVRLMDFITVKEKVDTGEIRNLAELERTLYLATFGAFMNSDKRASRIGARLVHHIDNMLEVVENAPIITRRRGPEREAARRQGPRLSPDISFFQSRILTEEEQAAERLAKRIAKYIRVKRRSRRQQANIHVVL